MHRSALVTIAATFTALVIGHGPASAQGFGVEIYVVPPGYTVDYGYPPPAYGPVYGYDGYLVRRPRYYYRGGCGTYRYWDGNHCVDARFVSPY